jgi:hypothetical protein
VNSACDPARSSAGSRIVWTRNRTGAMCGRRRDWPTQKYVTGAVPLELDRSVVNGDALVMSAETKMALEPCMPAVQS